MTLLSSGSSLDAMPASSTAVLGRAAMVSSMLLAPQAIRVGLPLAATWLMNCGQVISPEPIL